MPNRKVSAADVEWQARARCNGASADFKPDDENSRGLAYVQNNWCNLCPVRTECLAYALLYHLSGYWGGTGTAERRMLSYHRNRVKCPLCSSRTLIDTTDGYGICLRCGASWTGGTDPRLPEEAAG